MTNKKLISILILTLSLFFLGCIGEKPAATPAPTAAPTTTPTTTVTAIPTVVTTTPMPTPVPTQIREQKLYISEVDDKYGFQKVTVFNGSAPYSNHILTINADDTVKWVNVATDYSITVVSREGLWNNSTSTMRYMLRYFNYTFGKPGEFEVYIDKFPKLSHQKIVVNP
jgi:plastocyanin